MIRTGENTSGKINITDDICSENFELVKNWYNTSTLYIDRRFDMPLASFQFNINPSSESQRFIDGKLRVIEADLKSGNKTIISSETQLKSFVTKINYWTQVVFKEVLEELDSGNASVRVLIVNSVSKHEWIFIKWLTLSGVNFYIVDKNRKNIDVDREISDYTEVKIFNTNENLSIVQEDKEEPQVVVNFESTEQIETELYVNNNIVKVAVLGMKNYVDTCDFYGKLYVTCEKSDTYALCINGFDKPTQAETNSIPRFKNNKHDYIVETLLMYVKAPDKQRKGEIQEIIRKEFNSGENANLDGSILFNKMVYTIIVLNNLLSNGYTTVVYYGSANRNDATIIKLLGSLSNISIVVLMSDKSMFYEEFGQTLSVLELESSSEYFEMPKVDSRDNATTHGAVAQRIVDNTMYNGSVLGMYKPGMFSKCNTILFSTAEPEISLWWNKEMYIRPNFKAEGIKVTLPVMFKVINGVPYSQNEHDYLDKIQDLLYGNTVLCRSVSEFKQLIDCDNAMRILHGANTNSASYKDLKVITNGKVDRNKVKSAPNYRYGFMSSAKQDLIFDKIDDILNSPMINKRNVDEQAYKDMVLTRLLNLNSDMIKIIQWFEFYTDNPNLVLILPDENMLDITDMVLLLFMHMIGFDILIYVPTNYKSIDDLITGKFPYDRHNIGQAIYSVNTSLLGVSKDKRIDKAEKAKKSLFSKIKDFIC